MADHNLESHDYPEQCFINNFAQIRLKIRQFLSLLFNCLEIQLLLKYDCRNPYFEK